MPLIKLNDRSIKDVTSLPFGVGTLVHIQSQTASNSASISFTTGINSTYKEYQFYFIDIHARTDASVFTFQTSTNSGSSYGITCTSTAFQAYHTESDSSAGLQYNGGADLAQSTDFQKITGDLGNASDECGAGVIYLFNPSSTTYVKHFITNEIAQQENEQAVSVSTAGYFNTTSAINAVQFKMTTGNFDGTIALFGVL
jgi:hypothetical protein